MGAMLVLAVLLLASPCARAQESMEGDERAPSFLLDRSGVEVDSIIVQRRAGLSAAEDDAKWGSLGKLLDSSNVQINLKPGEKLSDVLDEYNARDDVEYAWPDVKLWQTATPNDTDFAQQWGAVRIGAPTAWDIATGATAIWRSVTVCIIDSGIDFNHPEIKPNLHPAIGYNAISNSHDPMDDEGHGTHVAGVIGAVGNNGMGIAGINWSNIRLLACKFMNAQGWGKSSDAIQCIDFCIKRGAQIISNSWDGGKEVNPPLQQAVERAGKAGVLFVVAAGNDGINLTKNASYPAAYGRRMEHVLVVGATNENDGFLRFSNYDMNAVHVSAPGVNIYSTLPGGMYGARTGTSMAAPFVSGAAALLLAVSNKTLTPAELKEALITSCEKVPELRIRNQAGGRIRLDWALQRYLNHTLSAPHNRSHSVPVSDPNDTLPTPVGNTPDTNPAPSPSGASGSSPQQPTRVPNEGSSPAEPAEPDMPTPSSSPDSTKGAPASPDSSAVPGGPTTIPLLVPLIEYATPARESETGSIEEVESGSSSAPVPAPSDGSSAAGSSSGDTSSGGSHAATAPVVAPTADGLKRSQQLFWTAPAPAPEDVQQLTQEQQGLTAAPVTI